VREPDLVKRSIVPDVLVTSHSAALGILFYQGKMFPKEYRATRSSRSMVHGTARS
jgi:glucose/arabinose dehydrogenase